MYDSSFNSSFPCCHYTLWSMPFLLPPLSNKNLSKLVYTLFSSEYVMYMFCIYSMYMQNIIYANLYNFASLLNILQWYAYISVLIRWFRKCKAQHTNLDWIRIVLCKRVVSCKRSHQEIWNERTASYKVSGYVEGPSPVELSR